MKRSLRPPRAIVAAFLAAIALVSCDPGLFNRIVADSPSSKSPLLAISIDSIGKSDGQVFDFGELPLGSYIEIPLALRNAGTASLYFRGSQFVALSGDPAFSIVGSQPPNPLLPSQEATVTLRFEPDSAGGTACGLSVHSDGGNIGLSLLGSGIANAVPGAPANLAASDGTSLDGIEVTWLGVSGFSRYILYRNDTGTVPADGDYLKVITGLGYTDADAALVPGHRYSYFVRTYDGSSLGPLSLAETGYIQLPTPTLTGASDGSSTGGVLLQWTSVSGDVDGYRIYRAGTETAEATLIASVDPAATDYSDATAVPGIRYWYRIAAYSADSNSLSSQSPRDAGYRRLAAPTLISASQGDFVDGVVVAFTGQGGQDVDYYTVWYGEPGQTPVYSSSVTSTPATVLGLLPGKIYGFRVDCHSPSSDSSSDPSAELTGFRPMLPPNAESDLFIDAYVQDPLSAYVIIEFINTYYLPDHPVSQYISTYRVYRSTSSTGPWNEISSGEQTVATVNESNAYLDPPPSRGTRYYYKLAFKSGAGKWSSLDSCKVLSGFTGFTAVTGLAATSDSTVKCTISFTAVAGVSKYRLYRSTSILSPMSSWTLLSTILATSYDDSTGAKGTLYYYRVVPYQDFDPVHEGQWATTSGKRL